jgi:hypothetical protein
MPLELHPARPDRAEQSNVQDYRQRPGEVERYLQTDALGLPLLYKLSYSWIYSRIHWPTHFAGYQFPLLNRNISRNDSAHKRLGENARVKLGGSDRWVRSPVCKTLEGVQNLPGDHDKKYSEADVQKIAAYLQTLR